MLAVDEEVILSGKQIYVMSSKKSFSNVIELMALLGVLIFFWMKKVDVN